MARVHHHRQVGQLLELGHRGQIQRVSCIGFKGTDAPLAEDDLLVAAGHDVLGAHEQLLEGVGKAALQKHRLMDAAQLLQKVKILHITRPDLDDIHILEQGQMVDVHDLGHDGQSRGPLGLGQELEALEAQTLERIGGRAGLEGAAAQDRGAGGLDGAGHLQDLILALHGAGAGDHAEVAAAQLDAAHFDHGIGGMEHAVALLEGLAHAAHRHDHLQAL